jgi:hypothetical protein
MLLHALHTLQPCGSAASSHSTSTVLAQPVLESLPALQLRDSTEERSACAQLQSWDASDSSGSIQCLIPSVPAWQIHSRFLEPTASRVLQEACQEFPAVQQPSY